MYGGGNWRSGDWTCAACQAHNFGRRDTCFKCHEAKVADAGGDAGGGYYEERRGGGGGGGGRDFKAGDWLCGSCQAHNFANRVACFKCGAEKDESAGESAAAAPAAPAYYGGGGRGGFRGGDDRPSRPGDWTCASCGTMNFASRSACFGCRAARSDDGDAGGDSGRSYERGGRGGGGRFSEVRDGDWSCSRCNANNFARRTECFSCHAVR